jgi:hypothetical protein
MVNVCVLRIGKEFAMFHTALERDMACIDRIRATSTLLSGTKNNREEEALVGLRYRIVAECQAYIDNEIKRLQNNLQLAAKTSDFPEIGALQRIVTTLTSLKISMQSTVGDEKRFFALPAELQNISKI